MGKTALAAQAVRGIVGGDAASLAASPFPHGVVFLDLYQQHGDSGTAWQALANAFDDSIPTDMPAEQRARTACAGRRALVILEGAEELGANLPAFIAVLAPESTLLVLTRDESQTAAARRVKIEAMLETADALALLRHLAGTHPSPDILDAVQDRLGGHPLALTWAGSQLGDATEPATSFLDDLRAQPFAKLSEPGGDPTHTLRWMFERSTRRMDDATRTVLAAAARVAEPFDVSFAVTAGGEKADLRRLVQLSFLRVEAAGWRFAHALAAQYAGVLSPCPRVCWPTLGHHALAGLTAADARCQRRRAPPRSASRSPTPPRSSGTGCHPPHPSASWLTALTLPWTAIPTPSASAAGGSTSPAAPWGPSAPGRSTPSAEEKATPSWQRESSVSSDKLGDLAVAQGDLAGALRYFTESKSIAERLAASDPANAAWQRRPLRVAQRNSATSRWRRAIWPGPGATSPRAKSIAERLAASDPANAAWQRNLSRVAHQTRSTSSVAAKRRLS